MARFRLWRFRRRYSRYRRQMAALDQATRSYDHEAAVDRFRENLSKVSLQEWQSYGLRERRWH